MQQLKLHIMSDMSSIMRRLFSFLRPYLIILLPLVLWLLIIAYWSIALLHFTDTTIYYGLIVFRQTTGFALFLAVVFWFFGVLLLAFITPRTPGGRRDAKFALTIILLFVGIPCSCVAGNTIGECGTSFTHEARIAYQQSLYQLAFIDSYCLGQSSYNLFRCDSLGLICDRVKVLDTSERTPLETFGNYDSASKATLTIESTGINILVNGSVLYTYYP